MIQVHGLEGRVQIILSQSSTTATIAAVAFNSRTSMSAIWDYFHVVQAGPASRLKQAVVSDLVNPGDTRRKDAGCHDVDTAHVPLAPQQKLISRHRHCVLDDAMMATTSNLEERGEWLRPYLCHEQANDTADYLSFKARGPGCQWESKLLVTVGLSIVYASQCWNPLDSATLAERLANL